MKAIITILFVSLFFQIPAYSQLRETFKERAREYRSEGYKLQSVGEIGRALPLYQKAIELDPLYAEAYNDIGVIYEKQGRLYDAEEYYKKALEINPDFMPVHTNLAFLYEAMGNIGKATYHWEQRYIRGQKGEYWHEVARQHLVTLGTYPEIRRERLEREAADLSRRLAYKREQERLEVLDEAKLYFSLGRQAFQEGAYANAIKNMNTVLSLDPADYKLQDKARSIIRESEHLRIRQIAFTNARDALEFIRHDDYGSAVERLQEALSASLRITREDFPKTSR